MGPETPPPLTVVDERACTGCGYRLTGLPLDGVCPECGRAVASSIPDDGPGAVVDRSQPCVRCGYNLRGLPLAGVCPECGTPVRDSLKGLLLCYASVEFRRRIGLGLSLVLNGILAKVVLLFAGIAVTVWMGGAVGSIAMLLADSGVTLALLAGYWLMTEPDPGYTGLETARSARRVLRWVVGVQVGLSVLRLALHVLQPVTAPVAASMGGSAAWFLGALLWLGGITAWGVQFFAMMRYVRWLAGRVPDALIVRRTSLYAWLLPVVHVVGVVACGLGPLVALVLYWNLLDRLRKHLASINNGGAPANLRGVFSER